MSTRPRRSLASRVMKLFGKGATYKKIMASPDRVVLVNELLPVFSQRAGQILWVGVKRYTAGYPALLERGGGSCWSTDIDPAVARFGAKDHHWTGDLLEIAQVYAPGSFTSVLCNGVLGFGVDAPDMQARAFEAMAAVMQPGGLLLLGWNTDRIPDPLEETAWRQWFAPVSEAGLPERRRIQGTTHVYDLLRRREAQF